MEQAIDLIYMRDTAGLEALIKSGEFNVNAPIGFREQTPLSIAAASNYIDVMHFLIKNGADVNLNNGGDLGYTPIEEAAREGHIEAIKLLLANNAEIDKGNTINTNALIGACIGAHPEALKFLIEKGANINHADDHGQTALHHLCRFAKGWGSFTISETVDGVTRELENPRFAQHTGIFNILLENGADATLETGYGYTPMHLCAESDAHTFITPLAAKGADVNVQNPKGFSPLHAAADRGNIDSCIALLNLGANVYIVDADGFTPLLGAVSAQNAALVKLLIEKGSRKDIPAKVSYGNVEIGNDAASLAKKLGNSDVLEALGN